MGFHGNKFTWRRGKVKRTYVAKRLDRVLCCAQTRLKWQDASVRHLPFLASSDHAPMYLQLAPVASCDPRRRPFRFEAAWMQHPSFKELLSASWRRDLDTPAALQALKNILKKWNKDVFGDIQKRKELLLEKIQKLQDQLDVNQTDELLEEESNLTKELELVLDQEEVLWFQKSREKWIALGDRNTEYFHTSTVVRRRRNRIEALKDDAGRWVTVPTELEKLAVDYYKRLYSLVDVDAAVEKLPTAGFPGLTEGDLRLLNRPFTGPEILTSVQSMGKFKSPGPDGFQPGFYQQCWDVVGPSVIKFALDFFTTGVLPPETNDALIVLIAKVDKPEKITQFRPISLCNVLFKIITKAMVLRMKTVMTKLIGPAQSSFLPGRLSTDNIVVVQEAVHSMKKKQGRKGWMLLKLDLEKAYDRIKWDFLEDTLLAAGFPAHWVDWISKCVAGPSMSVIWNGEKTDAFNPSRGLRQGDPLSPYLFVLCIERLCHLIEMAVVEKKWKPIRLSRGGPKLSHICFADDLILFAEASVQQIRIIRSVLERFCLASGQKVSLDKSKIFFSDNVHRNLATLISNESGIKATCNLGKYLGMPVLQKRINKDTFGSILERVASKLAGWKSRFLSMAGRITLTKAVLSSIPVHTMSSIALPQSTLSSLNRVSRDFIWGSTTEKRRQHLISWDKICLSKREGGLGIKSAENMNSALLAKLGWRLIHDKDSLWAKLLRAKYKVGDLHDQSWSIAKGNCSSTWRSICVGLQEVVIPGFAMVIGNGRDIRFWTDKWLEKEALMEIATGPVPQALLNARACDLWREGAGWDFNQIMIYLPEWVRRRLMAVVLDSVTGATDRLSWASSADGEFTVRTAYHFLTKDNSPRADTSKLYDRVWQVQVPERIRVFLWLATNQVLMTNKERFRRHLSNTEVCQVCKGGVESILHILRDCPAISGIWRKLVPRRRANEFFNQSLLEWFFLNLGEKESFGDAPWSVTFAIVAWWGWKWRCGNVFGSTGKCRDRLKFLSEIVKEVNMANVKNRSEIGGGPRIERLIAWSPPTDEWVKLNTDGASHGNPGEATAGGVLRDCDGNWIRGFAVNIGVCSAPLAELWGVYYGLFIAWEHGARRVELEVDSEMVVGFLKTGISDAHPLSFLARLCYGFISKDWIVRITHVYREANRLADGLANYAFTLPLGFHALDVCPAIVDSIVLADKNGASSLRRVRM